MKPAILTVAKRREVFLTNEVIGEFLRGKSVESISAAGAFGLKLDAAGNSYGTDVGHGKEWHERGKKFMAQNTERYEQ
jgi:hypothetical protein